jgi:hypothetical protein
MRDAVAVALARALPQMASLMTLRLYSIARLHSRRLIVSLARLGFCKSSLHCAPLIATCTPTHYSVSVQGLRCAARRPAIRRSGYRGALRCGGEDSEPEDAVSQRSCPLQGIR